MLVETGVEVVAKISRWPMEHTYAVSITERA